MRVLRSLSAVSGAAVLVATFAAGTGHSPSPAADPVLIASTSSSSGSGLFGSFLDQLREALEKAAEQSAAAQRPAQVSGVKATAGDQRIDLTWSVPSSKRAITGYTVAYAPQAGSARSVSVSSNRTTLTRLTNGVEYSITLAASSSGGTGPESVAVKATPMTVPAAPTGVAVVPGDGSLAVSWKVPEDDGGASVSGYRVSATQLVAVASRPGLSGLA